MTVKAPAPGLAGSMDVDEFRAFLETRPHSERWDLIEGVAVMMVPPSYAHRRIAYNLCALLNNASAARRLDLLAYPGAGVRAPGVRNFQPEPDVVVLPGVAGYESYSEHFQLVAEIVSTTNTRRTIESKLHWYREGPYNLYALVIEPRLSLIDIHAKRAGWHPARLTSGDEAIEMPEFGLSCRVVDLYDGTPLDPKRG
ncbi:MAG TPA: Uma2 family endonuclease [Xanthobacteraceae bacterium]|jgi:Uma2 family endonuclease